MKLAKYINDILNLVDVENGIEVGGYRTEEQLYLDGYKKACEGNSVEGKWVEYPTCFVLEDISESEEDDELYENN